MRGIAGSGVMLNPLRYRAIADYSASPQLAPATPIAGEAAYRLYMEHTLPQLERPAARYCSSVMAEPSSSGRIMSAGMRSCWCSNRAQQHLWHLRPMPNTLQAWLTARTHWKTRACFLSRRAAGEAPAHPLHRTDAQGSGAEANSRIGRRRDHLPVLKRMRCGPPRRGLRAALTEGAKRPVATGR